MAPPPRSPPREPLPDVLAGLPASVVTRLDTAPIAAAVRVLLAAGWRPVQVGARIGALPATDDPAGQVQAFLLTLAEEESPADRADRERGERSAAAQLARQAAGPPASAETIARCLTQVRNQLLTRRAGRPARGRPVVPVVPDRVAAGPHPAAGLPVAPAPPDG